MKLDVLTRLAAAIVSAIYLVCNFMLTSLASITDAEINNGGGIGIATENAFYDYFEIPFYYGPANFGK
jgi:hypothetical protein